MRLRLLTPALLPLLLSCRAGEASRPEAAQPPRQPIHVDSILPLEEDLRRLRQGMAEPAALGGAAPSLEALVARFLAAVEARDRAALEAMTLSREEFAWFYYPGHPHAQPPTRLGSGTMLMMIRENSDKGLNTILGKLGGHSIPVRGRECAEPAVQGGNTIIYPCRFTLEGFLGQVRLFGEILVRPEGYKFVSLANTPD